jgi:hypothetical protein
VALCLAYLALPEFELAELPNGGFHLEEPLAVTTGKS